MPGDPGQVEGVMPQHVCNELVTFQEGAWAFTACWDTCNTCGAQGTGLRGFMSAASCTACMARSPCSTAARTPGQVTVHVCLPEFHQGHHL